MKIKVCFEGEIHKLSNAPENLEKLHQVIGTIFQAQLPSSFVLKYVDSDGDHIVMTDEKDYEEFRTSEQDPAIITKVFVVPVQGSKKEDEVVIVENDQKGEDEEEYQLIQKEDEEELVPEDVKIRESKDEILIEKPENPVEEKESELNEIEKNKNCVKLEALEKLVSAYIEKSMPKITEYTHQTLEEQKSSVSDVNKSQVSEEKAIHSGVKCSGCEMMPIVGIRYKCQTCLGFNYCEDCEKTSKHTHHHFIKMKQEDIWDSLFPPLSVSNRKIKKNKKEIAPKMKPSFNNGENLYSGQSNEKPEEKMPDKNEAAYYDNLMEKVRKMLKCFPKAEADMLCAYVNEAPEDMTIEELIENYKH